MSLWKICQDSYNLTSTTPHRFFDWVTWIYHLRYFIGHTSLLRIYYHFNCNINIILYLILIYYNYIIIYLLLLHIEQIDIDILWICWLFLNINLWRKNQVHCHSHLYKLSIPGWDTWPESYHERFPGIREKETTPYNIFIQTIMWLCL